MHATVARDALGAPEGVHGDREAALVVNRVDRGGGRHARPDAPLDEQSNDVAVAAGHLFADDDVDSRSFGRVIARPKGALDGVVVCDCDHAQRGSANCVIDQFLGRRPAVAGGCVHMEVGPTRSNHGCAWYVRELYHRPFTTFSSNSLWWR